MTVEHEQLETKLYQDRVAKGDFDVAVEFQADFMDDPTAQFSKFLTKTLSPSGYSGHTDTKIDDLYQKQRRTADPDERTKIVREMERVRPHPGLQRAAPVVAADHRQPIRRSRAGT